MVNVQWLPPFSQHLPLLLFISLSFASAASSFTLRTRCRHLLQSFTLPFFFLLFFQFFFLLSSHTFLFLFRQPLLVPFLPFFNGFCSFLFSDFHLGGQFFEFDVVRLSL